MLYVVQKYAILFILLDIFPLTIQVSTNNTISLSFGFFCIYCGRTDHIHFHMSLIESKTLIDCSQPYHIYCSYKEAIGCVKYIKIIDYRIEIIKDCLRFTELSSLSIFDIQCKSEYSIINYHIKEKIFCCNNTHFCNDTISLFFLTKKWLLILIYHFILLIYSFHLISMK